jgi:hypothetical protein
VALRTGRRENAAGATGRRAHWEDGVGEIETDYLVVGAGASGMAFIDALTADADVDVVLVDRRHRPGGHWVDAYPFVRLHQPSAYYGVASLPLGDDRIDESGPNAGFYERATAGEICDHFSRALDALVASGKVRFLPMSDYRGRDGDGHHVTSLLTGADTTVNVRRRHVDATYVESSIPSRHTPTFAVEEGVRVIPPNALVGLEAAPSGFTVIGAGKTAMDTCSWLLDGGVDPGSIEWIRPRESWLFNRAALQPLSLVGSYVGMQARWVEATAEAEDGDDFARRLEAHDVFVRIDPAHDAEMFRAATISTREIAALRSIERVVRGKGKVRRIGTHRTSLDHDDIATGPGRLYIDCTATGLRPTTVKPVFEDGLITLQYVTIGIIPWGAATVGEVEAVRGDDGEKNRLCPPLTFTGNIADVLDLTYAGITGLLARSAEPDLADWTERCRLNPARGAVSRLDEPAVADAFTLLATNIGSAVDKLAARAAAQPG